jgi:hypothetical protein
MPPAGFKPAVLAGERPRINTIDRAAVHIALREWLTYQIRLSLVHKRINQIVVLKLNGLPWEPRIYVAGTLTSVWKLTLEKHTRDFWGEWIKAAQSMGQCRASENMVMKMEVTSFSVTLSLSTYALTGRVEAIIYGVLTMMYIGVSQSFSFADPFWLR